MGHKNSLLIMTVIVFVVFVVACDGEPELGSTPTRGINRMTRPSPSQTPTLVPSVTAIPIPSDSSAVIVPEETPAVTETTHPEPTSTATQSTILFEPFTIRKPEIAEIDAYLLRIATEEFPFLTPLTEIAELLYEDVNGDSEDDLIISDYLRVIILLWENDEYSAPFMLSRLPPWKYSPASRVQFVDYTNDSIPEVIFDHLEDTGGTGLYHADWIRYIIHCERQSCSAVWEGRLAGKTADNNAGGMDLFTAQLTLDTSLEQPKLRYISEFFSIYSYGMYLPISGINLLYNHSEIVYLTVFTSSVSLYEWKNGTFEFQNEQIISLPRIIQSNSILIVVNENGDVADIDVTTLPAATSQNNRCQFFLNGELVGETFGCKSNFTTIEWKDINGDGRNEIVIAALSAPFDPDFTELAPCVHQRYIVYEWDGQEAIEIINTYGCVVQDDLFGIRIEDFDLDGQEEIIAARWVSESDCSRTQSENIGFYLYCFRDLSYDLWIYKWNGSRFVFWDSVFGSVLSD